MDAELPGNKGKKKRLELNPAEAALVKDVFALYLEGSLGQDLGVHGIAASLNQRGTMVRGRRWNKGRVHDLLTNRAYIGEHYFNRFEKHRGPVRQLKPRQEWVLMRKLEGRSPAQVPPRIVNSPTLLTVFEKESGLGKKYLKLPVEEIRYQDKEIVMKGSYSTMAQAVGGSKLGTPGGVPRFGLDWLPGLCVPPSW